MKTLLVAFVLALACAQFDVAADETRSCPRFEIAIADDRGERAVTEDDGSIVHVDHSPLLTTADFAGANVSLTDGQIVLNINLSHDAGARIQAFTKEHVGVRLAFILDDRVLKVARILDPIHADGILMGPFPREQADALAKLINGKSDQCPAT